MHRIRVERSVEQKALMLCFPCPFFLPKTIVSLWVEYSIHISHSGSEDVLVCEPTGLELEIVRVSLYIRECIVSMEFSQNNHIVRLCLQGIAMEKKDKLEEASKLFLQAWNEATDDFEKFIAAHYVARHQKSISDKLRWLETDLELALKIDDDTVKSAFAPLYTNIAKCYEELGDADEAKKKI